MNGGRPFVVTVASEKGGVGKTTLATNLAVYLKALAEDLPVTIASFDNHFSVDNMFAIGSRSGRSVAGLFSGTPLDELVLIGEYGVQYLASERALHPQDSDPARLRQILAASALGGIFIVDTRPVIDYFTRNALAAADLLLIPVKDRASLVNAASILSAYVEEGGDPARAWLVPSIVDARLRLREDIGVREFLTFSAQERGMQVLDTFLAKSPKVESLATNLSSRVYPVLTHARQTVVHQQFRQIADFVLKARREAAPVTGATTTIPPGRLRRLARECPVCGEPAERGEGYFFHSQRSRGRGMIHADCFEMLLPVEAVDLFGESGTGMLLFDLGDAGVCSPAAEVTIRFVAADGVEVDALSVGLAPGAALESFLRAACGRSSGEFFRDQLLIGATKHPFFEHLADVNFAGFQAVRRVVTRAFSEM